MKTYIHYGNKVFNKNMFTKVSNQPYMTKPIGGLWASDVNAERGWKDWCELENFRQCDNDNSFTFCLSDNAKVLYINSAKDIASLPTIEDERDFGISTWVLLDFEKISETYDAIEVNISNDYNLYYKLYGWDCDSILVMNPDVIRIIE